MTLATLYQKTKGQTKDGIKTMIQKMLREGELRDLEHTLPIIIDFESGEISWKCGSCGYCTAELWELFFDDGIMIDRFDDVCCGYCKSMSEFDGEFDDEFDF